MASEAPRPSKKRGRPPKMTAIDAGFVEMHPKSTRMAVLEAMREGESPLDDVDRERVAATVMGMGVLLRQWRGWTGPEGTGGDREAANRVARDVCDVLAEDARAQELMRRWEREAKSAATAHVGGFLFKDGKETSDLDERPICMLSLVANRQMLLAILRESCTGATEPENAAVFETWLVYSVSNATKYSCMGGAQLFNRYCTKQRHRMKRLLAQIVERTRGTQPLTGDRITEWKPLLTMGKLYRSVYPVACRDILYENKPEAKDHLLRVSARQLAFVDLWMEECSADELQMRRRPGEPPNEDVLKREAEILGNWDEYAHTVQTYDPTQTGIPVIIPSWL